jgi:serine/threonine-protein kinase
MELRHLRYFVAIAEEQHMGRAAERLRVAQPSLSEQIRDLEREVGAPLFQRTPRGMQLTPAGELFLTHARQTLRTADGAIEAARQATATPLVDSALQDQLRGAVGSAYAIERPIGGPGSRLFVAIETALGRRVVIKALPRALVTGVSTERFRQEVQVAARLQHPHIVPALAAGSSDDLLYYTMPFVEGESLRDRMKRERQLPIDDAVRIARDVAEALTYAHGRGIVHRDITPDNILLADDHALVTNFWIARALRRPDDALPLTAPGAVVGTAAYMSPEQASGAPEVDARTDIYALGCVLFEMLAGEVPFTGPTLQAVIAARASTPAPLLRTRRTSTPEPVERAVAKALAFVPADRFPNAAAFARSLGSTAGP